MSDPLPTVTANGFVKRPGCATPLGLVAATLIQSGYGEDRHRGNGKGQPPCVLDLAQPLGTVVAGGVKHAVTVSHLLKLHGSAKDGRSLTLPLPTVRAQGTHLAEVRCFLERYYGGDGAGPVRPIIIDGEEYVISDIGLRMLQPRELYNAQGFRPDI